MHCGQRECGASPAFMVSLLSLSTWKNRASSTGALPPRRRSRCWRNAIAGGL
jgi:hypothetical protein